MLHVQRLPSLVNLINVSINLVVCDHVIYLLLHMKYLTILFTFLVAGMIHARDVRDYPFQNGTLQVPEIGSKKVIDCIGCDIQLSPFAMTMFNRPGDFHGPNCYNTALIVSGAFNPTQVRYVSPEEFEAILKQQFEITSVQRSGDVVVFDAKSSRGHAAVYLGNDLVYHKKSYGTQYFYRISTIDEVGIVEKNEWVPSPIEGTLNQFVWPELGRLPKSYYRFKKNKLTIDPKYSSVLKLVETQLLRDLGKWALAKNWGLVGKNIILDYQKSLSSSDPLTKSMLTSFYDQIGVYFEELHYKNSRNYDRTTEEICLPQSGTDELNKIYIALSKSLGKSPEATKRNWEKLLAQDKKRCSQKSF